MNAKQLAEELNGCEMDRETSRKIINNAHQNGLVIVYGYSDDGICFEGAISEVEGAYGGTKFYLNSDGLLKSDCVDECSYYMILIEKCQNVIEVVWYNDGYSWTYKTNIPHETFDVMEDGEKYCRGIVFNIKDLK